MVDAGSVVVTSGAVVELTTGTGGGRPGQVWLMSASGPLEVNWTKPGLSELMWELIQDW